MNDIIEMGRKMRQKRKELSLTLDEVAEVVKVAKSTVQRYEAGKIETPKIPVVREIAKALGVSYERLFKTESSNYKDVKHKLQILEKDFITNMTNQIHTMFDNIDI